MSETKIAQATKQVIGALLHTRSKRATKYLDERTVVSAQRVTWKADKHRINKRDRRVEVVLKIGAPNYLERDFIRAAKKAGEPFPIRKVQLKAIAA